MSTLWPISSSAPELTLRNYLGPLQPVELTTKPQHWPGHHPHVIWNFLDALYAGQAATVADAQQVLQKLQDDFADNPYVGGYELPLVGFLFNNLFDSETAPDRQLQLSDPRGHPVGKDKRFVESLLAWWAREKNIPVKLLSPASLSKQYGAHRAGARRTLEALPDEVKFDFTLTEISPRCALGYGDALPPLPIPAPDVLLPVLAALWVERWQAKTQETLSQALAMATLCDPTDTLSQQIRVLSLLDATKLSTKQVASLAWLDEPLVHPVRQKLTAALQRKPPIDDLLEVHQARRVFVATPAAASASSPQVHQPSAVRAATNQLPSKGSPALSGVGGGVWKGFRSITTTALPKPR